MTNRTLSLLIAVVAFLLGGCTPQDPPDQSLGDFSASNQVDQTIPTPTPLPTRPVYNPGELVEYNAQSGDTLPALAAHFNTTVQEILEANTIIPTGVTTLPPGLPMQIPIYHRNFWGIAYQIIPDNHFVNGPAAVSFDTARFVFQYDGWLKNYIEYAAGENRSGAEIVDYIAKSYSISPRVLLSMSEYLGGALSSPTLPEESATFPLGYRNYYYRGFYRQLLWVANQLNNGYYGWRKGELVEIELPDSTLERPDPWQNAASVSLHYLFSNLLPIEQYHRSVSPMGYAQTYENLFGNPWETGEPHIPGSLTQPELILPFEPGKVWAFTGGPHTGWGSGTPRAALDFAPASETTGCFISDQWTTAVGAGIVVRAEPGFLVLDMDMDGDERTGWAIFYLHISGRDLIPQGSVVEAGDFLGHPSCEGGTSTGTHIHVARKYNGEWILADSVLPFVMEGWVPKDGSAPYEGTLTRFERTVTACVCASQETNIVATGNPDGVIQPTPTEDPIP
jgi:murein DD-endopeptidase MepM/ murein hydrolase activator NlpD